MRECRHNDYDGYWIVLRTLWQFETFNLLTYKSNKMIKNITNAFMRGGYESPNAKVLSLMGQAEILASSGYETFSTPAAFIDDDEEF